MAYADLRQFLDTAKAGGELLETEARLSTRHEIAALLDEAGKRRLGPVKVYPSGSTEGTPVVGNLFHSRAMVANGMGVEEKELLSVLARNMENAIEPELAGTFPVTEVDDSGKPLDQVLPILTHYSNDSGPFITTGLISAIDPDTGLVCRGIHRMEQRGPDSLGIALINPPLGTLCQKALLRGEKLKVAVSIGLEPITFLGSALKAPGGMDKLAMAGALRGRAVEVDESPVYRIPVPARSEYLLEGEVDPADNRPDGPLGEISGYGLTFPATPTLRIKSILHRKNPIYHALSPAGREADLILTLVAEATLDPTIRKTFPFMGEISFVPGCFGSVLAVRAGFCSAADAKMLMTRLLTLQMVKKVVIVAEDVDPADTAAVEWSIATRCQPDRDLVIISGLKGQPIDPSSGPGFVTSKIAIDATGYGRLGDAVRAIHEEDALNRARAVLKGK